MLINFIPLIKEKHYHVEVNGMKICDGKDGEPAVYDLNHENPKISQYLGARMQRTAVILAEGLWWRDPAKFTNMRQTAIVIDETRER